MVEKIEMQKILPPVSSTGVKKVKQKNGNMQQENFGRHLKEEAEDNEEKKESKRSPETLEPDDYGNKVEEAPLTSDGGEMRPPLNKEIDDALPGRLIDILA